MTENGVGRFKAEIFSYARASGLFAGVSLERARVEPDGEAIRGAYGAAADSRAVLLGTRYTAPPAARAFMHALQTRAPARPR